MIMKKLTGICIAALVMAACNNSGSQQMVDLTPTTPVPLKTVTQPTQQTTTTAPSNNTNTGALNPKHGEPGHRCDIAEGAPLNTAPTTISTTIPTGNTVPVVSTPTTQPANKNVKLNPEHGQPGHDCSIPVGQPLKS